MSRAYLKTPAGQLALLGGTFAAALVLACAIATQRGFFERYVRETYAPPAERVRAIGRALEGADANRRLAELGPADREALYEAWMQDDEGWPAVAPARLVGADPDLFLARARRTLVCGSGAQRRRAARFLIESGHAAAREAVAEALGRARRQHDGELAEALQQTLAAGSGGPGRK